MTDPSKLEPQRLQPIHLASVGACALGLWFDLAEFALGNILSAVFSAPPHTVAAHELSRLLSAVYLGAIAGAFIAGWAGDRFGRRPTIVVLMIWIAFTSVLAAASPNIAFLTVVRALSGLALGAYPPLMAAYLTDILPPARRGAMMMITVALGATGPLVLTFMVRSLTPVAPLGLEGWRWAFVLCGVLAILGAAIFVRLPETGAWLASRARDKDAIRPNGGGDAAKVDSNPPSSAQAGGAGFLDSRIRFLLFLYFLTPWSTIGFPLLSGAVLIKKGVSLSESLLYVGVSSIGPVVGAMLAGLVVDHFGRRTVLACTGLAMGLLGVLFGLAQEPTWLMATGFLVNLSIAIFLPVLVVYAAETVPAAKRARATAWSWGVRGFGATLVPLFMVPLLHGYGVTALFTVMAATLVVFVAFLLRYGPVGAAGRAVD